MKRFIPWCLLALPFVIVTALTAMKVGGCHISWWLVLLPIWLPVALLLLFICYLMLWQYRHPDGIK